MQQPRNKSCVLFLSFAVVQGFPFPAASSSLLLQWCSPQTSPSSPLPTHVPLHRYSLTLASHMALTTSVLSWDAPSRVTPLAIPSPHWIPPDFRLPHTSSKSSLYFRIPLSVFLFFVFTTLSANFIVPPLY
ncbi:hypothetical protein EDB84DRAFT_614998 [Lactarius hengduanensis]|nr:hypothetical protein EDB84DRAFT_614998 [Lactarius hengduanensis]